MALVNAFGNPLDVVPENITGKFREAFETYTPGTIWSESKASGDLIALDGNAAGASYLVISKDPLTADTESSVTTASSFEMPIELAVGVSLSHRVVGQELSMELVSDQTPFAAFADLAISSIQQATTTLTVVTATAHGLQAGARIGIFGVTANSQLNYPALVVASVVSPTSFTCTAGPGGTIASLTVGPYTNQGTVYYRPALGYAQNGVSQIFENATATNTSMYVRGSGGDVLPSGTAIGSHSVTTASSASVVLASSAYSMAFSPTSEFRVNLQADRASFYDVGVDSTGTTATRMLRTQVVPDSTKMYKLRFRMTNNAGMSVPSAKIVSSAKSASTTATITTATAHGLTTGDYILIYGNRDQTNFANLTTQTVVASVINSTQFTIAYGASATATTYGGMVMKVQGGTAPSNSLTVVAIQSASVASGSNELVLVGNANWAFVIGDYVNVYGCRADTTGADMGLDGVYKVVNQSTTSLTLTPLGSTTLPSSLASTNCGGTVLRRYDARISFVRLFNYTRERVEVMARGDVATSVPVSITSTPAVAQSGTWAVTPNSSNVYSLVTSTNLAASATYTGSALNAASSTTSTTVYPAQIVIGVSHTAGLTPGQLYVDYGTETSSTAPTVWYTGLAVPIPSNANMQYFTLPVPTRYYRLRFVNGATAQTSFRLSTMLTYNGGGLSGQMSFPINLQYPLSTTALAASGVFTGVTMDFGDTMNVYQTLTVVAYSDQASASNGLQIQISRDGTNWRVAQQASVTAATLTSITAHLSYRYARVVYTNGATLQTTFNLDAHVDAN